MITSGIKLTLDVGEAVSAAGRYEGALHNLNEEVKKAEQLAKTTNKPKDWDNFARLVNDRDRLQGSSSAYSKSLNIMSNSPMFKTQGLNGQTIFKADPQFVSIIKTHVDAIKKLTAAYEAAAPGSDDARDIAFQIENQQKAFSKAIEDATGTGKQKSGADGSVKSLLANEIIKGIKSGLDVWVSSRDKTASINAYGSGDVIGGSFAERQRRANAWSGGLQATGAVAQGLGAAFAIPTMGLSVIAGTAVNLATNIASSIIEGNTKIAGNRVAYANLWDSKREQALNLAAIMGNPTDVRPTWKNTAYLGEQFGYSAEESAESLIAAARQGLGGEAVRNVFNYERRTGADRSALESVSYLSGRYRGGDALQAGWRGLNASGMQTAQFGEFLRSIERAMTDGIGKGFTRSSDEISKNMSLLALMTNNNPLWQGEQGANRLMKMYGGFENSTEMQDSTSILAFRAAKNVLGDTASYVDTMKFLENPDSIEGGFTALFNQFRSLVSSVEGGDRAAMVEHFRKQFGMTYNEADTLRAGGSFTDAQMREIQNRQRGLPEYDSDEFTHTVGTMHVRNLVIEAGQKLWDEIAPEALREANKELQETTGTLVSGAGNTDAPIIPEAVPYNIRQEMSAIESMITTVLPTYFGSIGAGSNRRQERAAQVGVESVFDRARLSGDDEQIHAAFSALSILNNNIPRSTRESWDREDKLNPLANSRDAVAFLAALNRLIEIEERNSDINVTVVN